MTIRIENRKTVSQTTVDRLMTVYCEAVSAGYATVSAQILAISAVNRKQSGGYTCFTNAVEAIRGHKSRPHLSRCNLADFNRMVNGRPWQLCLGEVWQW